MYKKRFAKWGLQKNSGRAGAAVLSSKTKDEHKKTLASREPRPSKMLSLNHDDGLTLMFLNSVRTWNEVFLESVQSNKWSCAPKEQRGPTHGLQQRFARTKGANFAFKLVADLLDRGRGNLAGRVARRAFLLAEDMLTLEGPVLVWNLLEIMHSMVVTLCHGQLFQTLLAHLIAMADGRMAQTHPLPAMLRGLRGLAQSLNGSIAPTTRTSSTSIPSSSSSCSPYAGSDGKIVTPDSWVISRGLPSLIERAWRLNAEIIFDHFDPRLLPVYFDMQWESVSIEPSPVLLGAVDGWVAAIEAFQRTNAATESYAEAEDTFPPTLIEENTMRRCLLGPRIDASPPRDFETLRTSSVAALRKHGDVVLAQKDVTNNKTTLAMVAALVKDRVLEGRADVTERVSTVDSNAGLTTRISRYQAGNLACVIRALVDLDGDHSGGELGPTLDAVEKMRIIVALRAYALGETHPQVIGELWLLEGSLVTAGRFAEARTVARDAYCRLEKYTQDIPVGHV